MKKKLIYWIYPPYLVTVLVAIVSFTLFTAESATSFFYELSSIELRQTALIASNALYPLIKKDMGVLQSPDADIQDACEKLVEGTNIRLTVIMVDGLVVADTGAPVEWMDYHLDRKEIRQTMDSGTGSAIRKSFTTGTLTTYEAVSMSSAGGESGPIVRAAMPFSILGTRRASLILRVFLFGAGLALIVSLIAFALSRRIIVPIVRIHSGALAFASGRLNEKIPEEGPLEIANLASVMNHMAEDLDTRIKTISDQKNEASAILNGMTEAVVVVDSSLLVIESNRAFQNLFPSSILSKCSLMEITHSTELCEFMEAAIRTDGPLETGLPLYGDIPRQIRLTSAPLSNGNAVLVINDLTRLNRLETIRSDFTTNVSHELKTPITAIRASLETMLDTGFTDVKTSTKFLEIAMRGTDRLEAILTDLMLLARIEENEKKDFERTKVDLTSVIEIALRDVSSKIESAGMTVSMEGVRDLSFYGHGGLIKQALINLLENAIKYSFEGGYILIRTSREGIYSVVSIIDSGPGIPENERSRIFERFYRLDKARSRDSGGTGLGLSIVKHIALAHSGSVRLECPRDGGSIFSLLLPSVQP